MKYHQSEDGMRRCRAGVRPCPKGGHSTLKDLYLKASDTQKPITVTRSDYTQTFMPKGGTVKVFSNISSRVITKRLGTKEARARKQARREAERKRVNHYRNLVLDYSADFKKSNRKHYTSTYAQGEMSLAASQEFQRTEDLYKYERGDFTLSRDEQARYDEWQEQLYLEAQAEYTPEAEEALKASVESEQDLGNLSLLGDDYSDDDFDALLPTGVESVEDLWKDEPDLYRDDHLEEVAAEDLLLGRLEEEYLAW